MIRLILAVLLVYILPITVDASTFDERLWEKYAGITTHKTAGKESLAGINISPYQLGDQQASPLFADLRIMNDKMEEVPWQIVQRRPEKGPREISAVQRNLSLTPSGETWVELVLEPGQQRSGAVEIVTSDTNFSRQVQVLGSPDGASWNTIRKDGVIFDNSREAGMRLTRISYPNSSFRYLALKITNGDAPPLNISGTKAFGNITTPGQSNNIRGSVVKSESDEKSRESRYLVTMNTAFPLDRISIVTSDRNFQRSVEVQVRRNGSDWQTWATGTVYNFDTDRIHESQLTIDIPEIAAKEFRLVIRDYDNPPLKITGVSGDVYQRVLVFKHNPERKFYLFWGNPAARMPHYDLGTLIAKENIDNIPLFQLEAARPNTKFAGDKARRPFTERYKHLLYGAVALAIIGLLALQYRVFRQTGNPS